MSTEQAADKQPERPEVVRNRKLTKEQVLSIREHIAKNEQSREAIGRLFGVSGAIIRNIANGVNYRDVR